MKLPEGEFLEWAKTGFVIIRRHWNELDYHRTSKFMSLVQMLLQSVVKYIEVQGFSKSVFTQWNQCLLDSILDESITERGLMLYVMQIYPSCAVNVSFGNVIQFFFCFKPIFDVLCFTTDKILRVQIKEKITDNFNTFVATKLNKEAREFVKTKLTKYALNENITQSGRSCFYQIMEDLDREIVRSVNTGIPENQRVGLKKVQVKKVVVKSVAKLQKKKKNKKVLNKKAADSKMVTSLPEGVESVNSEEFKLYEEDLRRLIQQNQDSIPEEFFDNIDDELQQLLSMQDDYEDMEG